MKLLLALSLFVVCAQAAYPWGGKRCSSDKDCDDDECCVSYYITKQCELKLDEGESCDVKKSGIKGFRFGKCPCKDGLECAAKKKKSQKGECMAPTTTNAPSSTAADTTSSSGAPSSPSTILPSTAAPTTASAPKSTATESSTRVNATVGGSTGTNPPSTESATVSSTAAKS